MSRVTRAVLPVAGLGTRFLPATWSVPKELLPLVDRPCLAYVVAEAIEAGIQDIVFVTARGKDAILDYFDRAPELEGVLEASGRLSSVQDLRAAASGAHFISVRQDRPLGLGHAVLCAAPATRGEDFAVMLPDDVIDASRPVIGQLLDVHRRRGGAVVALLEVPPEDTRRYGICDGEMVEEGLMRVRAMVEKPPPELAPSRWSIVGRYVLPAEIHELIGATAPGAGGEIQLTDALATLAARGTAWGLAFEGRRFDTGNPLGLLRATLHFALQRPELESGVRALLREIGGG